MESWLVYNGILHWCPIRILNWGLMSSLAASPRSTDHCSNGCFFHGLIGQHSHFIRFCRDPSWPAVGKKNIPEIPEAFFGWHAPTVTSLPFTFCEKWRVCKGSSLNRDFVAWKENSGNIKQHVTKISRFKNHVWFTICFHAKFVETQQNTENQHSPLCFPWWLHSIFLFFWWTVKFPEVSGVTLPSPAAPSKWRLDHWPDEILSSTDGLGWCPVGLGPRIGPGDP